MTDHLSDMSTQLARLKAELQHVNVQNSSMAEEVWNYINPLKGSGGRWLHLEVFSAIQV